MQAFKSKPITMSQPLIVSISEYQDKTRLDIRHYNHPEGEGDLYPTKKGVSVKIEQAVELIDGILAATAKERAPILDAGWSTIYAGTNDYKGANYFDIRHWWQPKSKRTLQPTDKGISIPVELVPNLIQVLTEVRSLILIGQQSAPIEVDLAAVASGSDSMFSNFEVD